MFVRRIWPSFQGNRNPLDPGRLLRDFENLLDVVSRSAPGEAAAGVFPALNITKDADRYHVRAELPGVNADELQISAEGAKLSISGRRQLPPESEVSYHRRERASGSFARTVVLPGDFDGDRVEAQYTDGILTITLPVSESMKSRRIAVKTEG